jgi:hypothetical protein
LASSTTKMVWAWVDISCIGLLGFGRRMGTQTAQGEVLKFFPMTKVGF